MASKLKLNKKNRNSRQTNVLKIIKEFIYSKIIKMQNSIDLKYKKKNFNNFEIQNYKNPKITKFQK